MLITAIAAVLVGHQKADLDTPVTVEVKTATVPHVMAELEKQTGVRIHVQGGPTLDYVYVNFKNRPLRGVLDVMAKLCEARWQVSDDQVYFSAPLPNDAEAIAERTKTIAKWLADNPVPPALTRAKAEEVIDATLRLRDSKLPNAYQDSQKLYQQTPTPRAHMRLIHALGAKELASITEGEARVYMISPRGRVKALPGNAAGVFQDLVKERGTYLSFLAARGLADEQFTGGTYLGSVHAYTASEMEESTWMLVVRNENFSLDSEMRGFADYGNGHTGVTTNDHLGIAANTGPFSNDSSNPFESLKDRYNTPEEWKDFIRVPEGGGMPSVSPYLAQRMANMDKEEVLTDFVFNPLHVLADSRKSDVAALLPDACFLGLLYGNHPANAAKEKTVGSALRLSMLTGGRMEVYEGAYLISPTQITASRTGRIPRAPTAKYIQSGLESGGMPDLDTTADLAVSIADKEALSFAIAIAGAAFGDDEASMMLGSGLDVLRIYGHFSRDQRRVVKNQGLTVPYANLSKAQQTLVERMISSRDLGLAPKGQANDIETNSFGGWSLQDMIQLQIAEGVPPNALVHIRLQKKNKLFSQNRTSDGLTYVSEANLESFAWQQANAETGADSFAKSNGFTYADRTYLQVTLDLGEAGFIAKTLPLGGPGKDAKYLSLSEMPKEFQDAYNVKLREFREQMKQRGGASSGGTGGAGRLPPP